jgi:hypothetical protein
VLVAVPVAILYCGFVVPYTVNDAVLADDAAGLNCHILKFDTVNATLFVKYGFNHTGKDAEPALTAFEIYDVVPVLSAVSKSQDIEFDDDVGVSPDPAGVVELPEEPVYCATLNVAGIRITPFLNLLFYYPPAATSYSSHSAPSHAYRLSVTVST